MTMLDEKSLQQVAEKVLALARANGASNAETHIHSGKGFTITVRLGEVETLEHHQDKKMDVTVYFDHHSGSISTSDFSDSALEKAVQKACNIAKFTHSDPYSGLADKDLLAFNYPDLNLYHPWNITEQQAIEMAIRCENAARAEDKRIINSEGASITTYNGSYVYANSNGFIGSYPSSSHTLSCSVIASDGHEMQRDYQYTTARDPQDLQDPILLAKEAAQRTVRRLGARKITTRHAPVIYLPEVARGLMGHFLSAISGGKIYRKSSFLLDKIDHAVFPKTMTLTERPHLLKAIGSAPFDTEGVKTYQKDLIQNGILKTYLLSSYSARKLGLKSTGNAGGAHNVYVSPSNIDFKDLVKQLSTGLIISELMGQGINMVTGDYSRGAFGFWVENGEIQYPVQEITIAGNLKNMFANIQGVANDIDRRGNVQTGSILIADMMIAGD